MSGFEELIRVRIAVCVGQAFREIDRPVLEAWLSLSGKEFDRFVTEVCDWSLDHKGDRVRVPPNKENEARAAVVRENVRFDRKFELFFLSLSVCVDLGTCLLMGFGGLFRIFEDGS